MRNPADVADRYVAVGNEPDPEARRAGIGELWGTDGVHLLQPPQMVATGGEVAAVGTEVLVLDGDGRIRMDYQFIEP